MIDANNLTEVLYSIQVIGEDFENHGGEVVLAAAAIIDLEERRPKGHGGQCGMLLSKVIGAEDAGARMQRVGAAIEILAEEYGREWLTETLEQYYCEMRPVPDRAARIKAVLIDAAKSLAAMKPAPGRLFRITMAMLWDTLRGREPRFAV